MPKGVYFKTEEHRANISKSLKGRKLSEEHINLISLCKQCHTKTNFNREYWKKFFQPFQIGVALYE